MSPSLRRQMSLEFVEMFVAMQGTLEQSMTALRFHLIDELGWQTGDQSVYPICCSHSQSRGIGERERTPDRPASRIDRIDEGTESTMCLDIAANSRFPSRSVVAVPERDVAQNRRTRMADGTMTTDLDH